ncbi:MAG: MarR family winged helix-turn-helix transcriptional regulator [Hyphomonadaceae bacterium]
MARAPDGPESEPYRLASSASHLLHRAEQLATDRFMQLVGDSVTLRQFAVLAAIAEAPGLSQADLVRATGIDRSTLAEMITRMDKRSWVTRTASAVDARAVSLRLAPTGAQILVASTQHARAADAAILDLLPRTKRRTFVNTLMKLAKLADEAAAKADRDARKQSKKEAREKRRAKSQTPRAKKR